MPWSEIPPLSQIIGRDGRPFTVTVLAGMSAAAWLDEQGNTGMRPIADMSETQLVVVPDESDALATIFQAFPGTTVIETRG